jgi:hypothetical protein
MKKAKEPDEEEATGAQITKEAVSEDDSDWRGEDSFQF